MRARVRIVVIGILAVAGSGALGAACRAPTQITLDVRTAADLRCEDVQSLAIVVAGSPEEAEARVQDDFVSARVLRGQCEDDHHIGTLVVTPGGSSGAVVVTAALTPGPCRPPKYEGCVVARRTFAFIDHASARLPITLEASCRDQPCDVLTSCRSGTCVSSNASCSADADCTSDAEPVTGPDGKPIPPDASTDATSDARSDAIADAPIDTDAPIDAPHEAEPGLYGNTCPSTGAGTDCTASGAQCCYMGTFFCQNPCTPGYYVFNCVGRKYCNGAYCCGQPNGAGSMPGTSCDTTGGQMCAQNGNHYICTSAADCPPGRPNCTGTYLSGTSGTVKECVP